MEHLVELRKRLIISVFAFGVGFLICFIYFSQQIYILVALLHPFEMAQGMVEAQKQRLARTAGGFDLILMVLLGMIPPLPSRPGRLPTWSSPRRWSSSSPR